MTILNDLEIAQSRIKNAIVKLEENPNKDLINELLDACAELEFNYKNEFCAGCDADFGDEQGTTYEDGISLEYYIESSSWHKISKVIRQLRDIGKYNE